MRDTTTRLMMKVFGDKWAPVTTVIEYKTKETAANEAKEAAVVLRDEMLAKVGQNVKF